jgi:DNA polymerase III subunit beta
MKLLISKAELVSLISKIQTVVPQKPAVPILANILLEAIDDQLIVSATDLMVSMRISTEAKVLEAGAITLPARRFFHLIRELTSPQVEIESGSDEIAYINAGSSHFKINGMHKEQFPSLPDLSDAKHFEIPNALLKEMLVRSSFAAARDDSRQVLNGILFQNKDNLGTFISTDGKRLAKIHAEIGLRSERASSYILPSKAVEEMVKTLDSADESAKLSLLSDKICLEVGSVTLISKLLSGQYPDVSRVIPEHSAKALSLHREELISLLRQVSLFTPDASSPVRFTFEENELRLTASSGEVGEGKVSMPVNYAGPKLEIAFNPIYFLDILRHCKDETVSFDISDSYNPGLISDSTTAQFVLMPMRLEN